MPYILETIEVKTVSNYLNISFFDVLKLNLIEFRFFLREAFIYQYSKTPSGIEYLKNAKRLETTKPDLENLRKKKKG